MGRGGKKSFASTSAPTLYRLQFSGCEGGEEGVERRKILSREVKKHRCFLASVTVLAKALMICLCVLKGKMECVKGT